MTSDMQERLALIRTKLQAYEARQRALLGNRTNPSVLIIQPDEYRTRVVRAHAMVRRGSLMFPRLSDEHIEAFEEGYGIALPEEYRWFLTTVGNGGEGPPLHGLYPLGQVSNDSSQCTWASTDLERELRRPFPLERGWVWGEDGLDPDDHGWHDEPPTSSHAQRLLLGQSLRHGVLALGSDGGGKDWLLVVSGPETGQVWHRSLVGIVPLAPRRTFLSWYEHWLEGGSDWWAEL